MSGAFYLRDGDRYRATELTRGPWDPGAQHAGPPAALLAREIERLDPDPDFQVARITIEILRSVPIGAVSVSATLQRPGKRVQLIAASLRGGDGEELMRASAWRLRSAALELADPVPREATPPGPELGRRSDFFPTGQEAGYHTAMQWRSLRGGFGEPGPATMWFRMRQPSAPGRGAIGATANDGQRRRPATESAPCWIGADFCS